MAISTDIVGKEFGPFIRSYTFKDLEICALGCNAGYDGKTDLEYINEKDATNPALKFLPIFGDRKCTKSSVFSGFLHSLQWFDPRKSPRCFQA